MAPANADEAGLLAAIYAAPFDDGPRLVYADWLLERGKPLGKFIQAQLQGDDAAAQAQLSAAVAASMLPVRSAPLSAFRRGFLSRWASAGAEALSLAHHGAWSLIETLELAEPRGADFFAALGARLTSLSTVHTESGSAIAALVRFRPQPLRSLVIDELAEWFDFTPVFDATTAQLSFNLTGVLNVRREGETVHLSVPRRLAPAGPIERVLRDVVRPEDEVVFTFNMGRRVIVERIVKALQTIPHRRFTERELLVIG